MVGKPNLPDDVDTRDDLKGSAVGTPGLTALDEEREASLADEGGASGATMESQDIEERRRLDEQLPAGRSEQGETDPPARGGRMGLVAAIGIAAALGALACNRWRH
jgi:hypothetical protein